MQFPGEPQANNLLMFKGHISVNKTANCPAQNFAIKVILINGFPFRAPKVYIDQQLNANILRTKNYLGQHNEITIAYLTGWNMSQQPDLKNMMTFIQSVIQSDPPVLTNIERNSMFVSGQAQQPQASFQQPQQAQPGQFFDPSRMG